MTAEGGDAALLVPAVQVPDDGRHRLTGDLYATDGLFLTGTDAEVTPIRSVDGVVIGEWLTLIVLQASEA